MSTPRDIQAGVPQGSTMFPTCRSTIYIYLNDTSQRPGVYLGLFTDDTSIYATYRKEGYVLRKLQRVLNAIETCCERWNIKVNENKTQDIYFSHRLRSPEAQLTLNGRNISLDSHVIYLGVG
jgi:hypothetical protein